MLEYLSHEGSSFFLKTKTNSYHINYDDLYKIIIKKQFNFFILSFMLFEMVLLLPIINYNSSYLFTYIFTLIIFAQFFLYTEFINDNRIKVEIYLKSHEKISFVADTVFSYDFYFIKSQIGCCLL